MKIVAYDTETTGFPPAGKIIEFSFAYPEPENDKTYVLNPDALISMDAAFVNGYTIDKPVGTVTFAEIRETIESVFRENDVILVYHDKFEYGILDSEYERLGEERPPVEFYDVYKLVKRKLKGKLASLSLKSVATYLGYTGDGYHSSLFDSRATLFVYSKLINEPDVVREIVKVDSSVTEEIMSPIRKLRDMVQAKLEELNFTVNNESDARRVANTIAKLTKIKRLVESSRQTALAPIKSVVIEVESLTRTSMLKPIAEAISKLTIARKKFVAVQMLSDKQEHDNKVSEAAEKSQKLYNDLIAAGSSHEEASDSSDKSYLARLSLITPYQDTVVTTVDIGKVIDTIKFDVIVSNESEIPREFMMPNMDLLNEVVNTNNGEIEIPGIEIVKTIETKVRSR